SDCRLRSLVVKVRDLGLGYDSDEIVRFKYCSGSCQQDRTSYDLILSNLLEKDAIVPAPDDDDSSHPCCRPTRFKDFAFMDVRTKWAPVPELCLCVAGRMEWRVERPRHRSERSPSAYRCLPVHQVHFWELGLWGTLTLLSLFAGTVMATHQTWHHNQKLGATSGGMGTANSVSMEENSQGAPSLGTRSNWHGEAMAMQRSSAPEPLRAVRFPERATKVWRGSRKAGRGKRSSYCHLKSLMVKVGNLGLGFQSNERIRFNYCSGSCQQVRTNHDLALSTLVKRGAIKPRPDDDFSSQPCCRPTRYDDISFVDLNQEWNVVIQVSAAECSCVGF
ncbi:hypothetical protein JD844_007985, partial [Phrynosoma platyrhinos]